MPISRDDDIDRVLRDNGYEMYYHDKMKGKKHYERNYGKIVIRAVLQEGEVEFSGQYYFVDAGNSKTAEEIVEGKISRLKMQIDALANGQRRLSD